MTDIHREGGLSHDEFQAAVENVIAERNKKVDAKGVEISKWAEWDVNLIVDVFLEALTDANAHTLRGLLEPVIERHDEAVAESVRARDGNWIP